MRTFFVSCLEIEIPKSAKYAYLAAKPLWRQQIKIRRYQIQFCFCEFCLAAAIDDEDRNILARKTNERITFTAEEDSWVINTRQVFHFSVVDEPLSHDRVITFCNALPLSK